MTYALKIKSHSSEDRLEKLIDERLKPGADKKAIDQRIWDLFGEEWAIMFTDLSGFSRQVAEFGIIHFLQIINESKKNLVPIIDEYDGILLKLEGDSMMIIFRNPQKAIDCAVSMQKVMKNYNQNKIEAEKNLLCIGIGFGKVLRIGDDDVFGAEVNAASKLGEDTAKANEIIVTGNVMRSVHSLNYKFEKMEIIPPGADSAYRLVYSI